MTDKTSSIYGQRITKKVEIPYLISFIPQNNIAKIMSIIQL
jgi:hypothetical protein